MATQFADITPRPLRAPTSPKPNIRIAFVAGAAACAVDRAVRTMPTAKLNLSLDEMALAGEASELIEQALTLLSPALYDAFLQWGRSAAWLSSKFVEDEEGDRRCELQSKSIRILSATSALNFHDFALKAYVQALEASDSSCFGPLRKISEAERHELVISLAADLVPDACNLSPLPGLIERLAAHAWSLSNDTQCFSIGVGEAISGAFDSAIEGRASPSLEAPAPLEPMSNVGSGHWASQYRQAVAAVEELHRYNRVSMTPATDLHEELLGRGLDVAGILPIVREREEVFGGLVNKAMAATSALFLEPLPNFGALTAAVALAKSIDMNIGEEDAENVEGILSGVAGLVSGNRDHAITQAFLGLQREMIAYQDRSSDMPADEEEAADLRVDRYEAVLHNQKAQTLEGVIAKLRNAFQHVVGGHWSDLVMTDLADPEFKDGLKTADTCHRLLWSSIEDLARIGGIELVEQEA